jgi:hypothetical protein
MSQAEVEVKVTVVHCIVPQNSCLFKIVQFRAVDHERA